MRFIVMFMLSYCHCPSICYINWIQNTPMTAAMQYIRCSRWNEIFVEIQYCSCYSLALAESDQIYSRFHVVCVCVCVPHLTERCRHTRFDIFEMTFMNIIATKESIAMNAKPSKKSSWYSNIGIGEVVAELPSSPFTSHKWKMLSISTYI